MFAAERLAVLSDGAAWNRNGCEEIFAGQKMTFILDQCHALGYAAAEVRTLNPNKGERQAWMVRIKELLNNGPVGSGVVESACKQNAGNRFKRCCWSKAGGKTPLAFKRCIENNRWADFLDWTTCRGTAA